MTSSYETMGNSYLHKEDKKPLELGSSEVNEHAFLEAHKPIVSFTYESNNNNLEFATLDHSESQDPWKDNGSAAKLFTKEGCQDIDDLLTRLDKIFFEHQHKIPGLIKGWGKSSDSTTAEVRVAMNGSERVEAFLQEYLGSRQDISITEIEGTNEFLGNKRKIKEDDLVTCGRNAINMQSKNKQDPGALPDLPHGGALNMVLIGKTDHGKSETGNTILVSDDSISSTEYNRYWREVVGGRQLNVVDTPGCMDTERGDEVLKEIAAAVTKHPEGYDAFLIVMKYPLRMTDKEMNTIKQLEVMFGEEVYDYAVVIFTHGDSFEAKQRKVRKDGHAVMTFKQYIAKDQVSGNKHSLRPLFKHVNQRVLDEVKRREMVCELVKSIDGNNKSHRYDNHIFEKARQLEKQQLSEAERVNKLTAYLKKIFASCSIM